MSLLEIWWRFRIINYSNLFKVVATKLTGTFSVECFLIFEKAGWILTLYSWSIDLNWFLHGITYCYLVWIMIVIIWITKRYLWLLKLTDSKRFLIITLPTWCAKVRGYHTLMDPSFIGWRNMGKDLKFLFGIVEVLVWLGLITSPLLKILDFSTLSLFLLLDLILWRRCLLSKRR